jgi:hypothetical protein
MLKIMKLIDGAITRASTRVIALRKTSNEPAYLYLSQTLLQQVQHLDDMHSMVRQMHNGRATLS